MKPHFLCELHKNSRYSTPSYSILFMCPRRVKSQTQFTGSKWPNTDRLDICASCKTNLILFVLLLKYKDTSLSSCSKNVLTVTSKIDTKGHPELRIGKCAELHCYCPSTKFKTIERGDGNNQPNVFKFETYR